MILPSILAGFLVSSCQADDVEIPADELYTREFVKQFGVSDPSQDWNFAGRLTATVNAADFPGGSTVYVYDRMPGADGCQLSAKFSTKAGSFDFDFSRANSRAYVQVVDANGTSLLSSYLPITDSTLKISTSSKSRAGETPNVTLINFREFDGGNTYANAIGSFNSKSEYGQSFWSSHQNMLNGAEEAGWQKYLNVFNIYGISNGGSSDYLLDYYRGEYKTESDERMISDLASLVGRNGVVHEGVSNINGMTECNLHKYRSQLNPENGVIYDAPNGEVALEYIYGAAAFYNSLGYFYYRDGASEEEILKSPKFILMLDASPWGNTERLVNGVKDNTWCSLEAWEKSMLNEDGIRPSKDVEGYDNSGSSNVSYKPSFYKLIYYPIDEDGNYDLAHPTYKFEKGIKIAFFLMTHGFQKISRNKQYAGDNNHGVESGYSSYVNDTEFRFSLPWMNRAFGIKHDDQSAKGHGNCAFQDNTPMMSFVSYKWNGTSVMGVEDGTYGQSDHDMNDILFFVHGVEDNSHNFETYPFAQSWVIACEDLGSTYDFDFNDMVFGVSYVATQDNDRKVYIRALAAGGTLPIELYRTNKNGEDEKINPGKSHWNHWFGDEYDASMVINATAGSVVNVGDEFSFDIEDGEEFSLSSSMFREGDTKPMGGFKVKVNGKTWVHPIGTTGEYELAPQMILLPPTWKWPKEGVPVYEAYPGGYSADGEPITSFSTWCKTSDYTKWSEMLPVDNHVVSHGWQGHKLSDKE